MRYSRKLEPALYELNFTINPGEKIAVVGRTGSGKSSLF
jgi:ABC-type transport system involved in cytochrome bd biosynthesis fused ATPase/permease subunit